MQDLGFQNKEQDPQLAYSLDLGSGSAHWPQRLYLLLCCECDASCKHNCGSYQSRFPCITVHRPLSPPASPAPAVCCQLHVFRAVKCNIRCAASASGGPLLTLSWGYPVPRQTQTQVNEKLTWHFVELNESQQIAIQASPLIRGQPEALEGEVTRSRRSSCFFGCLLVLARNKRSASCS